MIKMVKNKNEQDGEGMLYMTLRHIWIFTDFVPVTFVSWT